MRFSFISYRARNLLQCAATVDVNFGLEIQKNMASQKRYGASEQAPLLASGQESDDDDDETIEGNRPTQDIAFLEKAKFWLAKTGKWLWANAMIVAIVMLVIAGIVVLAVYFAGPSRLRLPACTLAEQASPLRSCSTSRERIARCLFDTLLRSSFVEDSVRHVSSLPKD